MWRGSPAPSTSAGAMAMGSWTLIRERMPGDDRRRYGEALNLVPGVAVLPHFDAFGKNWVPSALERAPAGTPLVGIDERTGAGNRPRWICVAQVRCRVREWSIQRRARRHGEERIGAACKARQEASGNAHEQQQRRQDSGGREAVARAVF